VKAGHIFIAMPPLYRIDIGKNTYYALDNNERDEIISKHGKRMIPSVQRFKGLGEMNPPQLRDTTMSPQTRRLIQITIEDDFQTSEVMSMLLAKRRAGDRFNWLQDSALNADLGE
jgi:topoisomerase-4 subunit B